jgi:hypothetical protein
MRTDPDDAPPTAGIGPNLSVLHKKIYSAPGPGQASGAGGKRAGASQPFFQKRYRGVKSFQVIETLRIHWQSYLAPRNEPYSFRADMQFSMILLGKTRLSSVIWRGRGPALSVNGFGKPIIVIEET